MDDQNSYIVRYLKESDSYSVVGWLSWNASGMPVVSDVPAPFLGEKVEVVFRRMNSGYWKHIEKNIIEHHFHQVTKQDICIYNFSKMRGLVLKFFLKSWSLPIPISHDEHGILQDVCYERVMDVHPNILRYFVGHVEKLFFLTDEDRESITKQSLRLFGGSGTGVHNPHEAISMFCDLSQFWEKFGLNYFDLQLLPQDVYIRMKTVISNEIDIRNQKSKQDSNARQGPKHKGKMIEHTRF